MNHNSLIYQDSNAYQIGRKDGYDEIMRQMNDIIDKCYNTGYKDAMDFACEWMALIDFEMQYQYIDDGYTFFDADQFIKDLRKAMEEHLCKETSN